MGGMIDIKELTREMVSKASDEQLDAWNDVIESELDKILGRDDYATSETIDKEQDKLISVGVMIEYEQDARHDMADAYPTDIPRDQLDYEHNQSMGYSS